jgi:uncharacterized membrane protein
VEARHQIHEDERGGCSVSQSASHQMISLVSQSIQVVGAMLFSIFASQSSLRKEGQWQMWRRVGR